MELNAPPARRTLLPARAQLAVLLWRGIASAVARWRARRQRH